MARTREALPGALKLSGWMLMANAVLQLLAWIAGGFGGDVVWMLPFAIAYLLAGAGLFYRFPKIRYPALIVTLAGGLAVYMALDAFGVGAWLGRLIIAIDLVVIVLLAASIWRGRKPI